MRRTAHSPARTPCLPPRAEKEALPLSRTSGRVHDLPSPPPAGPSGLWQQMRPGGGYLPPQERARP